MTTRENNVRLVALVIGPGVVGVAGAFLLQAIGGFETPKDPGFALLFFGGLAGSLINLAIAAHDRRSR